VTDTDTWVPPTSAVNSESLWIERYALAVFYLSTGGANWNGNAGWLTPTSVCGWSDSGCDGDGRVTLLVLGKCQTVGKPILMLMLTMLIFNRNSLTQRATIWLVGYQRKSEYWKN
jgi:hypothetical protein